MTQLEHFQETENGTLVTRGWGEGGIGDSGLKGTVLVLNDEKGLGMDGGNGWLSNFVNVLNATDLNI